MNLKSKLRKEVSISSSGKLLNAKAISVLKDSHYFVEPYDLDGDAPKEFIRAYFYEKDSGVRKANPKSWFPYIAKSAEKWYPHESVIEFMINRIGETLDINMNQVRLLVINGQIRFLSQYFLNRNETLNHGAEICGEYLDDHDMAVEIAENKNTARELFTFEFIEEALKAVFPSCYEDLVKDLIRMTAFDALAGNNDRHFYNWAVIDTKKKTRKKPKFAPIYDSARGLLWNFSDENVVNMYKDYKQGGKRLEKYINKASPRISIERNNSANHFELIQFIKNYSEEYKKVVDELSTPEYELKVQEMISEEFFPYFIDERKYLISKMIEIRFNKVREI